MLREQARRVSQARDAPDQEICNVALRFGHCGSRVLLTKLWRAVQDDGWRPNITVKQVVTGIQQLLDAPNEKSPAQADAYMHYTKRRNEYRRMVIEQAKKYQCP
jgi:ubiquitin-protein ligase